MSYIINKTDGSVLLTLLEGTLDTSTSLYLIGRNYPSYGELQQENFVRLLENGAADTSPIDRGYEPLTGELWYETVHNVIKVYDGDKFKPVGTTVSDTQPLDPQSGDTWWDTENDQLKSWNGTVWLVVGPVYNKTQLLSGPVTETLTDGAFDHVVVSNYVNGERVSLYSNSASFSPTPSIFGFANIQTGFNVNIGSLNPFSIQNFGAGNVK